MSAERPHATDPAPDAELARALEALPEVEADPAFEARLRARFLGGDEPAVTLAPAPRRGSPLRLVATLVTLAAAVLVAFLLTTRGGTDAGWTLVASRPDAVHQAIARPLGPPVRCGAGRSGSGAGCLQPAVCVLLRRNRTQPGRPRGL